jgi:hypothetical protein
MSHHWRGLSSSPTGGSLHGRARARLFNLARMVQSLARHKQWADVFVPEFEAFLSNYPRPLEARPPLSRKANYREWMDPTLGGWPDNVVAKIWKRGSCTGRQVRRGLTNSGVSTGPAVL